MRTQQEIADRIKERKEEDMFGFEWHEYVAYLDFKHARPLLKDGVTPQEWSQEDQAGVRDKMKDYMPFAWDKANSRRGISAWRSLAHYKAWLWIEGSDEAVALADSLDDYTDYGKPQLRQICRLLDIDPDGHDDGRRGNTEEQMESATPLPPEQRE